MPEVVIDLPHDSFPGRLGSRPSGQEARRDEPVEHEQVRALEPQAGEAAVDLRGDPLIEVVDLVDDEDIVALPPVEGCADDPFRALAALDQYCQESAKTAPTIRCVNVCA